MIDRRFRMTAARLTPLVLFLVFALVALPSCGSETTPSFGEDLQGQMEQVLVRAMSRQNIPGVIAGVWVPGRGTWTAAVGEADMETGLEITTQDKMRIASNTKTFVATVVLQLVDEGVIGLDDPLEEYITGVPNGDQITIRQILNMTAGIYNFTEDEGFLAGFTADPLMEMTPRQQVDIALAHDPYFPPGQGWHYSDTNYEILGMIIEEITGERIEDEIQRRILDPLELTDTSFPTSPEMPPGSSRGYVIQEDGGLADYTLVNPSIPWAGGAMISSLEDMKVWARSLATGELISQATQEERLAGVPIPGQEKLDAWYGLGIFGAAGFLGHTGAVFGYNSVAFYLPEEDATIIVMANKSTNESEEAAAIFSELGRLIFPEYFPEEP